MFAGCQIVNRAGWQFTSKMFKSSCSAMFKLKFSCLAIGFSFSSFFLTPSQTESQLKFGNANFRWLAATCVGWAKRWKTCAYLRTNFELDQSERKSAQVIASTRKSWPNGVASYRLACFVIFKFDTDNPLRPGQLSLTDLNQYDQGTPLNQPHSINNQFCQLYLLYLFSHWPTANLTHCRRYRQLDQLNFSRGTPLTNRVTQWLRLVPTLCYLHHN